MFPRRLESAYYTAQGKLRWMFRLLSMGAAPAFNPTALVASLIIFLLLSRNGQMQQLYFRALEGAMGPLEWAQLVLGALSLALLSATLFVANYVPAIAQIDVNYAEHRHLSADRWVGMGALFVSMLCAAMPWMGLVLGLMSARRMATDNIDVLGDLISVWPLPNPSSPLDQVLLLPSRLHSLVPRLDMAAVFAVGIGATVVALCVLAHRSRVAKGLVITAVGLVAALLMLPALLTPGGRLLEWNWPMLGEVAAIELFRTLGPIAMFGGFASVLVALLVLILVLAKGIKFPVIGATFVVIFAALMFGLPMAHVANFGVFVFSGFALLGAFMREPKLFALGVLFTLLSFSLGEQVAGVAEKKPGTYLAAVGLPMVQDQFRDWTKAREKQIEAFAERRERYPVFIVAAQGGGIYAATAASTFLSRMHARCPAFTDHTFAISAVSGGAVGATLFHAGLPRDEIRISGCAPVRPVRLDDNRVAAALRDDHLSPLLGLTIADLIGFHRDRGQALEIGFQRSASRAAAHWLGEPFRDHWRPTASRPALVLNATSVDTGHRIAFAPFSLYRPRAARPLTLEDIFAPKADIPQSQAERIPRLTMIQAAGTSARFPGISPALRIDHGAGSKLNLVDGGYADGSGATTALDIYRDISSYVAEHKLKVDVRLVLLVDKLVDDDLAQVSGTSARDTLAPFIAVLKVREQLYATAVKRAYSELGASPSVSKDDSPIQLVELDSTAFNLALGWTISHSSFDTIALLMGHPTLCLDSIPSNADPLHISVSADVQRVMANSCTLANLERLLTLP